MKKLLIPASLILGLTITSLVSAQGGNIGTLDQWNSTTTPSSAITQRIFGKALKISGLTSGCLGLDSNNLVISTGGGCSSGSSIATTTTNTWVHQIFSSLFATNASSTNATTTQQAITSLTSGRIPYATTGGRLIDSANLTFSGTALTIADGIASMIIDGYNITTDGNLNLLSIPGHIGYGDESTATYAHEFFGSAYFDGAFRLADKLVYDTTKVHIYPNAEIADTSFPLFYFGRQVTNPLIDESPLTIAWDAAQTRLEFQTADGSDYPVFIGDLTATSITANSVSAVSLTSTGNIFLPNSNTLSGVASGVRFSKGISVGGAENFYIHSAGDSKLASLVLATTSVSTTGSVTPVATSSPNSPRNIAVCGNYGYAINQTQNSIVQLDLSTKSAPTVLSATSTDGTSSYGVACDSTHVYVGTLSGRFNVFATTTGMSLVGTVAIPQTGQDVVVSGNYAYVSGTGMTVVDITTKTAPSVVATRTDADRLTACRGITKSGNYVYMTCENGQFRDTGLVDPDANVDGTFVIYDVSTPTAPLGVATTSGSVIGDARDVTVLGTNAYVTSLTGYVTAYDVSTPGTIATTSSLAMGTTVNTSGQTNTPGWITSQATDYGDFIFFPNILEDKVQVVDVTNPADMEIYREPTVGDFQMWGIASDADYLYFTRSDQTSTGAFYIYSFTDIFEEPTILTVWGKSIVQTILPRIDSAYSIGSSAIRFLNGYFDNLYTTVLEATNLTATNATTTQQAITSLTSDRVPYATTGGRLVDDADLLFNGTKLTATYASTTALTVSGALYNSSLTSGRVPYVSTSGRLLDTADFLFSAASKILTVGDSGNGYHIDIGTESASLSPTVRGGGNAVLQIISDTGFIGYGGVSTASLAHEFFGMVYSDTGFQGNGGSLTALSAGEVDGLTLGSVPFSGGINSGLQQDNANFFWNDTDNRLGIGTSTPIAKLEVYGGGLKLDDGGVAQPTCTATIRGEFWYIDGAAGVKDQVEVCAKDAANVYAWRVIY